jgi:hypothetical protein
MVKLVTFGHGERGGMGEGTSKDKHTEVAAFSHLSLKVLSSERSFIRLAVIKE